MILFILSILIYPFLSNINISFISFTIFVPLISIILAYNYLKPKNLIIYSTLIGILEDVLYTHFIINTILYPLIALLIIFIFKCIKYKLSNIIVLTMSLIFLYNSITYFIYDIFINISYVYLITNLIFIYIFNLIYLIILYILFSKRKHKI